MNRIKRVLAIAMVTLLLAIMISPVAVQAEKPYTFTQTDPPSSIYTQQYGINAGGDIVGAYRDGTVDAAGLPIWHGYLYSVGEFIILDVPSDIAGSAVTVTNPASINSGGDIVGYYRRTGELSPAAWHGFLRTRQGEWSKIDAPEHLYTMPNSILADGTILGCVHEAGGAMMLGVTLKDGVWNEYPTAATDMTMHNGATPNGKMTVGQYRTSSMAAGTYRGYLLDDSNFIPFSVPNSTNTVPYGINPAGVIIGYYNDNTAAKLPHGFMVQPQGLPVEDWNFTTIDVPGAGRTILRGINAGGDLVGTYSTDPNAKTTDINTWHGFLLSRTQR